MRIAPTHVHGRLKDFIFADWKWVAECLKAQEIVDNDQYVINWKKILEDEGAKKREALKRAEETKRIEDQKEELSIIEKEEFVDKKPKLLEPVPINEELQKSEPEDEEVDMEKLEKPRKKVKVRENEELMTNFRHLYDYRFGIEEEGKVGEPESSVMEEEDIIFDSDIKIKPEDKKGMNLKEQDEEDLFESLIREAKEQDREEEKGIYR